MSPVWKVALKISEMPRAPLELHCVVADRQSPQNKPQSDKDF